MADNEKKPIAHVLPAILTGAAALIAALTTVYINVRGDKSPQASEQTTAVATAPRTTAPASVTLHLQVNRIAVQHDGSIGTTDWRFAVAADGQPLFVFGQNDLDETGGRNVALPTDARGDILFTAGKPVNITIQGWRGSRLRLLQGDADVQGEGKLAMNDPSAAIKVQADKPDAGAFVFYFSVTQP